ncbi:MAG: LysM peptidoglycan-binding domain-containing protein [Anaerolineae bacterium]|nr:LysM peptidoglycan-binding domain-containing protein [Anaerolineae bacterium]
MYRSIKVAVPLALLIAMMAMGLGVTPAQAQTRPGNYVQRTIVCTTNVFREAGGFPVPGAVIQKGQRWYVSPTPTTADRNGRRWTAIWVSGIGYIPAECVAGQENLAPAAQGNSGSGVTSGGNSGSSGSGGNTGGTPVNVGSPGDGARGTTFRNSAGQLIYVVAAGDRLYRISLRFGVTIGALQAANKIGNANLIYPGMQLLIPGK